MGNIDNVLAHIDRNLDQSVHDLQTLLRQPSISAQSVGLEPCAELLRNQMIEAGIANAQILPTDGGPPVVIGHLHNPAADRTLLCYGHYDVQPPEPLELWHSDPFGAEIRDGVIYARGATDNKGGVIAFIKAAEAFLKVCGAPPVNLVFLFEGEEEIGSPHLEDFVEKHKDLLQCDASIGLDGGVNRTSLKPEIHLGIKAILYVELRIRGLKSDIWSGRAQTVKSPVWRLVHALASIFDPDTGRVLIDGWYDDWLPPDSDDERFLREELAFFDRAEYVRQLGATHLSTNDDLDLLRRTHFGASANICGLLAGYTGEGGKTIVPAEAMAKLDFRCPPKLEPERQLEKLNAHLLKHGYDDIEVVVHTARKNPYKTAAREAISQATITAAEKVFGTQPLVQGVSIQGIIMLSIPHPAVLSGFGAPDNNLHAPNENMPVNRFHQGIAYAARIMDEYAQQPTK
ncbi:M20/M25/M40 family metallo-hydrolase [Microvirga sp. BT689]|uniref:M20/M25/M40 family metallo-hydrolase n=1 Tax=Microvirga arvi TaxID=2778731 RepID=UPI0019502FA0|nr:M20/M25/M40 family metallo-hydrolase [Microvirga arvi]MBM6581894.1 M20/M25/M40 family metallo-hydrolase [Microvirga arvi]